jgi:hypothetical protein
MTFSTPLKILVACFAVAALVATAMSGSESAGLKGSRQLQGLTASAAVASIISNSDSIIFSIKPQPVLPPPNAATVATNTVFSQANDIFMGFNLP